jgi:hypothetical protein
MPLDVETLYLLKLILKFRNLMSKTAEGILALLNVHSRGL